MTPTGTLANPNSRWTVALFFADGYDWWVDYRSYLSEYIAREIAKGWLGFTKESLAAVFISTDGRTWQTVGTKFDIPTKPGRPLDE